MSEVKVLFCCMGNICRSPMAEGVFRTLVEQAGFGNRILVDSAGTHADFPNSSPDPRALRAMAERGIDISGCRARRIVHSDFERFDLILAMDWRNHDALRFMCPKPHAHKLGRLLDYAPQVKARDVLDPFHGDESAFEHVLEIVEIAAKGLLDHLRESMKSTQT